MRSYRTLALREIGAQKITSVLILIAIVLSTTMTAAVGQSAGVLAAMRKQQAVAIGGDRHASFVQLTEEKIQALEDDPRVSYVGRNINLGSIELNDLMTLGLAEYWDGALSIHPTESRLAEGRLPEVPMEIALPKDALQLLGFSGKTGDKITLSVSKALRHGVVIDNWDYTAEFVLTGILESNYLGYTSGLILGLAGEGTAAQVLPEEYIYYNAEFRVADGKRFQDTMDSLCAQLEIHQLDTLYNIPYLNALGIRYDAEAAGSDIDADDSGFPFVVAAGVLAAALILLAAGLVIYNILKIAVSQRVTQYGALRAIGAEKRSLYTIVAAEVLLLCAAGIPAGLLLGWLSARGILTAALNQLSPEMFLAQDTAQLQALAAANSSGKWMYLLLSAAITLLFAFLASAPAARFAANVSPVTAMSGTAVKIRRGSRNAKKIRHFERYYARLNLSRSRGRTAITILSLVMSITVFVTLYGVPSLLDVSGAAAEHLGDYSIVNQAGGFSAEETNRLAESSAVAALAAQQYAAYSLDEQFYPVGIETDFPLGPGEIFQIFGMNGCWMDNRFSQWLTPEQLAALKAGEGCVVRNPIPMEIDGVSCFEAHIATGQTITVAGKKLPVLLALGGYDGYFSVGSSGFVQGVMVLVSDRLYPELTGKSSYAELRPVLARDADRAAFDRLLDGLCQRVPGTTYVSYEEADRQLEESGAQLKLLAWGLILFVALIGILNIINTVYTNIHTRVKETGVQRAVGMSAESLCRTFLWEGAYYAGFAAVIGCAAGYLCTVLVELAFTASLELVTPPVGAMLTAAAVSTAACLLATAIPLRKLTEVSIVDAIEAVE